MNSSLVDELLVLCRLRLLFISLSVLVVRFMFRVRFSVVLIMLIISFLVMISC